MVTKQLHRDTYYKVFDYFDTLVQNRQPVYTIVKHDPSNYDLVDYYTRKPYLTNIPFKLTAERLMDRLNRGLRISEAQRRRFQEACDRYEGLCTERPFLKAGMTSCDPVRRQVSQTRLDLVDARIANIEDFLFIDDK